MSPAPYSGTDGRWPRCGHEAGSGMSTNVAVVGGGPAGAITAALLARACGVFTSLAAVEALRRVGTPEAELRSAAREVSAMRVETARGTSFRLTYGFPERSAVGLDRERLDATLLAMARASGVEVREGTAVVSAALGADGHASAPLLDLANGDSVEARIVVGADGSRSVVAEAAAVRRGSPLGPRVGLTFHVPDQIG